MLKPLLSGYQFWDTKFFRLPLLRHTLSLGFLLKFIFIFIISDGKKHGTVTSEHASLTYSKIVLGDRVPINTMFPIFLHVGWLPFPELLSLSLQKCSSYKLYICKFLFFTRQTKLQTVWQPSKWTKHISQLKAKIRWILKHVSM